MSEETPGRTAIIADRHSLGRNLVRFLLEEEGFEISAEAATIAEVLLAIQHQAPDVLVVHENLTHDHDPAVFAQIRQLSPNTNLVLMTGNRDNLAVELIFIADAVVEEGPGLGQLAFAAGWQAPSVAQRAEAEMRAARARRAARRGWRPPWGERLDTRGAVAASIIVVAVMLVRAAGFGPFHGSETPGSPNPSIRAQGPGVGASTASATVFELASYTSPATEDASRVRSRDPAKDPGEEPDPDPRDEPGPDPGEQPPPAPNDQPPGPPGADGSDPQETTVVDDVIAPAEDVVDGAVGTIDEVVDGAVGTIDEVVDGAVGTIDEVVDEVEVVVDDVVAGAGAAVDGAIADVDDAVDGVVGDVVGDVVGGLG